MSLSPPPLRRHAGAALLVLVLAALLATSASADPPVVATGQAGSTTQLLVKFNEHASAAASAAALKGADATEVGAIPAIGVRVVTVPSGRAAAALAGLQKASGVDFAEPNAQAQAADVPNDPSVSLEWGLSKIRAPEAWSVSHSNSSVIVAVLDTGVSLSHPDLASKIATSKNFSSSSTVDDVNGHGSHAAGIAAAATNNGVGVAGLGYDARIENVKVLNDDGSGLYSAVAQGITWAADNGANVINMSLVGTSPSATLQSAIDYAWSKGVVVVAAAGNFANSTPTYPASYANVIAVAATTDLDRLASFSDYGDWVDVAAPGISIYSTIPGGYTYMSGTSMAAPYVSGLAALLFARLTDTNGNGRVNDEVRAQIQATADNIGLSGIGSGRIDAYRALTEVAGSVAGSITGTVTDASTGAGLAGATVSYGAASAVTNTSGGYTLSNVPAGTYTVSASTAGYATASQSVAVVAAQTTTAALALAKTATTGSISGKVTDATGTGIAGATVNDGSASATTDSTGAYALAGVPAGSYNVTASASGYLDGSTSVSVTAGQTAPASFTLAKPAVAATMWVSGVTFKSSGPNLRISASVTSTVGPVAGAQVQLSVACTSGAAWTFSGTTDSTGTAAFAIQKAPKGTYTVTVTGLNGPYPWDTTRSASLWTFTL
jgi:thermitase